MEPREVRIKLNSKAWFVSYVNRKKYGHYSVAQFDRRDHDREHVKAWITSQKKLRLIED